jgi:hypothetical protein
LIAEHHGVHSLAADNQSVSGFGPIAAAYDVHVPRLYMECASGILAEDQITFAHYDLNSGRRFGPTHRDAPDQPGVYVPIEPSDCANSDLDPLGELQIGLQLVVDLTRFGGRFLTSLSVL